MENTTLRAKLDELAERRRNMADYKASVKKPVLLNETTIIDGNTGLVTENKIEQQFITQNKEPAFIKLYLDDLILINNLPTSSSNILWELVKGITYDNEIMLNSSVKKRICARLDIKMQTLDNALTKFVKKQILFRVEKGIFLPNPYLFAKGSWNEVKELRMVINYTEKGKTVQAEINGESAIDTHSEEDIEALNELINKNI